MNGAFFFWGKAAGATVFPTLGKPTPGAPGGLCLSFLEAPACSELTVFEEEARDNREQGTLHMRRGMGTVCAPLEVAPRGGAVWYLGGLFTQAYIKRCVPRVAWELHNWLTFRMPPGISAVTCVAPSRLFGLLKKLRGK